MRLTKAQRATLENIASYMRGRPVRTAHFTYAPLRRLIKRKLVEQVPGRNGFAYVVATPAGRAALSTDGGER